MTPAFIPGEEGCLGALLSLFIFKAVQSAFLCVWIVYFFSCTWFYPCFLRDYSSFKIFKSDYGVLKGWGTCVGNCGGGRNKNEMMSYQHEHLNPETGTKWQHRKHLNVAQIILHNGLVQLSWIYFFLSISCTLLHFLRIVCS